VSTLELQISFALFLATLCLAAPPIRPAHAQGSTTSYSRALSDPFEKYSYESVQAMVNAIRAQGHAIPTGHPRIFINPANRAALRQKIAAHYGLSHILGGLATRVPSGGVQDPRPQ
jgi:hypothetical protein